MARPIKGGPGSLARAARQLSAIGLIAAMSTGCAINGRVVVPTAQPPRLLDPTVAAPSPAPGQPSPVGSAPAAQPTPASTAAPSATPAPAGRTLQIIGVVAAIDGVVWVVDGLRVRVPPAVVVAPGLGPGSLVRVVARVRGDDDDDDGQSVVALSVEAVRQVPLVGQIIALDGVALVLDGRRLLLPPGFIAPPGLAPGVIVRVVVDDDGGGALVVRLIEPLVGAQILGGPVQLIEGDIVVIGGQRLRLAPEVVLWRVRLALGEPVRIIVVPVNGVLTIVTITIVTIIAPPAVVVVPMPPPPVYVPPPPPAPRPVRPPSSGGGGGDDDDDDD